MNYLGVCMSSMLMDADVNCWCCYVTPPSEQLREQCVVCKFLWPMDMAARSGSAGSGGW